MMININSLNHAQIFTGLFLLFIVSCTPKVANKTSEVEATVATNPATQVSPEAERLTKAKALAKKYIITDGHVDLPYRLRVQNFQLTKEFLEIPVKSDKGDFDHARAKKGGLDAPFMSIYLPARYQSEPGRSKEVADTLINMVESICAKNPSYFQLAKTSYEVKRAVGAGLVALPMGMENGSGLEDDLKNVAHFKKRGISYITLTHSKDNLICDSSYDTTGTWQGLSPYGRDVVNEMMKQKIMIDISHVSDNTFFQVMEMVKVPVIASHSSCRKYTPGFERNMSDDMIKKLGENGGVMMINFGSTFLDINIRNYRNERRNKLSQLLKEKGLEGSDEAAKIVIENFNKENPQKFSDINMVADHIDHAVSLAGIDHVGFGSDYDGVGDSLPTGLKDVADYPNLIAELIKRGYSDEDIEKICSGNLFRVWEAVESYTSN